MNLYICPLVLTFLSFLDISNVNKLKGEIGKLYQGAHKILVLINSVCLFYLLMTFANSLDPDCVQ